jgi:hypothetical protein
MDGEITVITGTMLRTASYTFLLYWEPQGPNTDLNMGGRLGKWLSLNERAIDKNKSPMDAIRLVCEQFPTLSLVECRHSNGLLGRFER